MRKIIDKTYGIGVGDRVQHLNMVGVVIELEHYEVEGYRGVNLIVNTSNGICELRPANCSILTKSVSEEGV